jgi:AraC-like DNA-binding protein
MNLTAHAIHDLEEKMEDRPIVGLALDCPMRSVVESHSHRRGQLMFCSSGVMVVQAQGVSWVASPNRGVWIPPGVNHTFSPSTRIELRNLLMLPTLECGLPERTCFVGVNPLLRELILRAITPDASFRSSEHRESVLKLIVDELEPLDYAPLALPEAKDPRVRRICEFIKEYPADNRTLQEWAQSACASARTLERLFIKETGLSFANWRRQARLIHSTVRMSMGDSVVSAAIDAGYNSTSAFIDMFRRSVGETPGRYVAG